MPNITISLTETENKAMEYAVASVQDWADNAVTNRARIAVDEICGLLMTHCNENGIALAVGKDAQVTQAFELGIAKTAADREAEFLASLPKDSA